MKLVKKAYPISIETWKEINHEYQVPNDYPEKYRSLTLKDIAIGVEGDGANQKFIIEPFFPHVLQMVFDKKVKVHVDLYADPAIVVEMNGRIVLHNADVETIKLELDKVIDKVAESNRIHAMTEIRQNMYNQNKIGPITRTVRNKLTELLPEGILFDDAKLNYDFMKLYFMEKYHIDKQPEADTLAGKMRSYTKTELLAVYSCLIEKIETGESWYAPGDQLLRDGYSVEEILEAYKEEILYRFYIGEIS